ncbi:cytochrome P450 [Bradyrhizobium sp. CCBAU 51753]|uniref:cytochrome P450 n=1 Tax=Bradyrhizobium sp. CCBAU 51753 TaxID=1325100 RepID=UPI00188C85CF|nr:cytochrome P450 [Bradyrhizobium sp. CCBAU 51753]QOZ24702.1 cytochrome P450 [Bradyrhizobium sp. CCBAU 51753]
MSDSPSASYLPEHPPVTDWVNDFDHTDPVWTEDPFPIWETLRSASPVVHTERFLGCYMPTTYQAVKEIAYDTEHFSSRRVIVRDVRPDITARAPPITSDPPEHKPAKQVLLPPFTPDAMKRLEPRVRAICNELIDEFIADGGCDAAARYTKHIPVRAIAHMLGIPEKDGDLFIKWIHQILELGIKDDNELMNGVREMTGYFMAHLEQRKLEPGDDLISQLLRAKGPGGQPLSDEHVLGSLRLLLIAGIDTTWSAIGSSLWHLARTPADRERLVAEPALMPTAIEEFLRAYSPVTMAREVMKETTVSGCPVKSGNMVLLSFPAANRDPAMFPDADKVVIDRKENRHAAFGLGIHRCVGSNLARMEMTVAIEEWLKRIPDFRLDPAGKVTWSEGTVRGPRQLPILFGKPA